MSEQKAAQAHGTSLFEQVETCLLEPEPARKVTMTNAVHAAWSRGQLTLENSIPARTIEQAGRPLKPELVAPRALARRSAHTLAGRAALIHALCHIEFNAINLALDAAYRFRDMPSAFYTDWLQVAREEAYHFSLLAQHLASQGYAYGDFPAHNGLWEMALETDHDVMVRMALVPRVMEARGLDVTPSIINKLSAAGDEAAVDILRIIQRDEVGHVEIGTRWFRHACALRGLDPFATFKQLLTQYLKGPVKGPYDMQMRKRAGFSDEELAYLESVG
jgi:uncharacterized ferritin-like protein (DUF455 family)